MGRVLGELLFGNGGMMMQRRVWKLTVVCLTVSALLFLGSRSPGTDPGRREGQGGPSGDGPDREVSGLLASMDQWQR